MEGLLSTGPTPSSLKTHLQTHTTGEKPFKCRQCVKASATANDLKLHNRTHTGEKPFICLQCDKAFSTAGNLQLHTRSHTGEKPYVCTPCQKSFSQSGDLKRHRSVHGWETETNIETEGPNRHLFMHLYLCFLLSNNNKCNLLPLIAYLVSLFVFTKLTIG